MKFRCSKCGHEWETTARSVIGSKCGCPKCSKLETFNSKAKENFLKKLSSQFELIEYINYRDVTVKCNICGNVRHTTADNILRFGCKSCAMKPYVEVQTKTQEDFIKESKKVHGDKYDYSKVKYVNCHTKVTIICQTHGEFEQMPLKHLYAKQGCSKCAGLNSTFEDFLEKAHNKFGNYYDYSKVKFKNFTTPIIVTCPIHGDFEIIPTNHINAGCGCKQCNESNGEKLVNSILTELNIPFTRELTIINPFSE